MKNSMKTIVKIMVAAIVAMGMACVLIMHGVSGRMAMSVYLFVALAICALTGVFDERKPKERAKLDSIRHRDDYQRAA